MSCLSFQDWHFSSDVLARGSTMSQQRQAFDAVRQAVCLLAVFATTLASIASGIDPARAQDGSWPGLAAAVVEALFSDNATMLEFSPAAAETLPSNYARNSILPFHSGVMRWYQHHPSFADHGD